MSELNIRPMYCLCVRSNWLRVDELIGNLKKHEIYSQNTLFFVNVISWKMKLDNGAKFARFYSKNEIENYVKYNLTIFRTELFAVFRTTTTITEIYAMGISLL
jgi:hypothetical protein